MMLISSPLSATENEESEISDEDEDDDDDDVSEEEMPSVKPAKKKQKV